VAVLQFRAKKGQPEASREALGRLIATAGDGGAQLIVCPEMAVTGYLFPDANAAAKVAEPASGDGLSFLGELAVRHGAYLICGYPELTLPDKDGGEPALYNAARVIGPDGRLLYNYRKRLLYDSDFTWAAPGDTPYPLLAVGDYVPPRRLTAGICMDLNDDRFTAFLRRTGPELVAFCTNWLDEGVDILPYWQYRLLGTRGYFLAANTYGVEEAPGHPRTRFCGGSAILGPSGRVLGRAPPEGDAVVLADLQDL
jgi:predicted amidohydrolase